MNIDGLGEKIIEQLINNGLIKKLEPPYNTALDDTNVSGVYDFGRAIDMVGTTLFVGSKSGGSTRDTPYDKGAAYLYDLSLM